MNEGEALRIAKADVKRTYEEWAKNARAVEAVRSERDAAVRKLNAADASMDIARRAWAAAIERIEALEHRLKETPREALLREARRAVAVTEEWMVSIGESDISTPAMRDAAWDAWTAAKMRLAEFLRE